MTCIPEAKTDIEKRAGVCLACSYHCHEGHELIELYTKRNFRCDCGNKKFPNKCNLDANKTDSNELNTYNHNFAGVYCICERPYPDLEDTVVDDMIQCIMCEDWYHCRHLNVKVPEQFSYAEMICNNCIMKHSFLLNYSGLSITTVTKTDGDVEVKVAEVPTDPKDNSIPILAQDGIKCVLPKIVSDDKSARFWPDNWRTHLCTCELCKEMYENEKVGYIIDLCDTVHAYEEKGKAKALENNSESQYEQGMKALSSLERTKQVEAITEYNTMKEHLKEYLQKFAENKKIVREEDIREFFSIMAARKKQKVDIPYFCR